MSVNTEINSPMQGILPKWFRMIRSVSDSITGGLNILGTLLIIAIMLLVNSDVIGRGLFGHPVQGVPEMVSMSIVAIVFLQVAQAFRKGRLTQTDALLGVLKRRTPSIWLVVQIMFGLAALWLVWQMFSASVPMFEKAWERNTFEGTIGSFIAPVWPVKLIILIGSATLMLQLALYALEMLLHLLGMSNKKTSAT